MYATEFQRSDLCRILDSVLLKLSTFRLKSTNVDIIKSKFCEMYMGIVHYNRLNNVLIFSQLFKIRGSYIFNIMTTGPIYISGIL